MTAVAVRFPTVLFGVAATTGMLYASVQMQTAAQKMRRLVKKSVEEETHFSFSGGGGALVAVLPQRLCLLMHFTAHFSSSDETAMR